MPSDAKQDRTIWTIGHSNRDLASFLALLTAESIGLLADVRRFPASRKFPQFNGDALEGSLAGVNILYRHFPALGGRRNKRLEDSPNTAWRVASFNAYADHMRSDEFQEALNLLMQLAAERRTAIMCAEALPWQCHRRIIADALIARGWTVLDIMGSGKPRVHQLTEFARVRAGRVTYPGGTLI
jgi:uncharacterized protein (DUF488 family)